MRLSAVATSLVGLAGIATAGSSVVSPASGSVVSERQNALECFAYVRGVTPKGVPTALRYEDGKASNELRGPQGLGYQPRDVAYSHFPYEEHGRPVEGRAALDKSYWFTLSGTELREVVETDKRDASGVFVSATYRTRVVRKNWDGARQMSIGKNRDYVYVLTNNDQLLRYSLTGKNGSAQATFDQVVGVDFATIGTFEYVRTFTDDAGVRSDVFVATDADTGALIDVTIPADDPTAYTRTVLRESGWSDMRSVGRLASCLNPTSGRTYDGIVGVGLDGAVRLWTDRDSRDGLGDDIVSRGVIKSSWTSMSYDD